MDPLDPGTAVQPPEEGGQGEQPPVEGGLYDLQAVPENLHEPLLPILKKIEGNVTKKFQEAAEYRKQWEPYQEMGLTDIAPEELTELLAFREIAQDPEQFEQWYRHVGQEWGLNQQDDLEDEDATEEPELLTQVQQLLEKELAPFKQRQEQEDQQRQLHEAATFVRAELDTLKSEHGEYDEDVVSKLALAFDGRDAIKKGFAEYQKLIAKAEQGLLTRKSTDPETPPQGGKPGIEPAQPVTSYGDARSAALERLRRS